VPDAHWRDDLASLPTDGPMLLVGNEFLDALPVRQLVKTPQGWRERMVGLEGERLDRYIQNLLDMTRLGHQGLSLKRDWIGVDELIGSATRRLIRYKPDTKFDIQLPADIPQLYVHPALIEQAIFNVLENAEKFSPPDKLISELILN
jgi:K+-sensing histidine kinase KdpD